MPYRFLKFLNKELRSTGYQVCFYRFDGADEMHDAMIRISEYMAQYLRDCYIDPAHRSPKEWREAAYSLRHAFPQWIGISDEYIEKWAYQGFPMNPPDKNND